MITSAELKAVLSYNKATGLFRWRFPWKAFHVIAGSLHSHGYIHIKIYGRQYKAHRLAWLYVTGAFPKEDVEHRNRNKSDNRWRNLRLADDSKNQANAAIRKDNTSGFKSVVFRKESGKWRARIQVRNKRIALGSFTSRKEAHAAYVKAAKKYFGEFARAA